MQNSVSNISRNIWRLTQTLNGSSKYAIQKITGKVSELKITDYGLASISGGATALCEVTITVEDPHGNSVSAKSIGEDIVTTSVQAVIDGINRIMLKKMLKEKQINWILLLMCYNV